MYTQLKDIFWQDQFTCTDTSKPLKLDRDRYFIGMNILAALYVISLFGGQFMFAAYSSNLLSDNRVAFELLFKVFNPNLFFDPLILLLSILLSARAFNRLQAIPLGCVYFLILTLGSQASELKNINIHYTDTHLIIITSIVLVWLAFQVGMLTRPRLKTTQPNHPLLQLNPHYNSHQQFNAVQYMWCLMLVGLMVILSAMVFSLILYFFSQDLSMGFVITVIALMCIAMFACTFFILLKRLRNLNIKPRWWLLGLIGIPVAFSLIQAYLYSENYFEAFSLFALMFAGLGLVRFAMLIAQIFMLTGSANYQKVGVTN